MSAEDIAVRLLHGSAATSLCRLCLSETADDFVSISDVVFIHNGEIKLEVLLQAVTPDIPLQANGLLSERLCHDCYKKATNAYEFRLQCLETLDIIEYLLSEKSTNENTLEQLCTFIKESGIFLNCEPKIRKSSKERAAMNEAVAKKKIIKKEMTSEDEDDERFSGKKTIDVKECVLQNKIKEEKKSIKYIKEETPIHNDENEQFIIIVDESGVPLIYRYGDEAQSHIVQLSGEELMSFYAQNPQLKKMEQGSRCGSKKARCTECEKCFSRRKEMYSHMSIVHGLHICKVCNVTFDKLSSYNEHCPTHSTYTPYTCEVCNKSFKVRSAIIKHLKSHVSKENQAKNKTVRYTCHVCGLGFHDVNPFERHLKKHAPDQVREVHKCKYCNMTLDTLSSLRQHWAHIHPLEQPYQCEKCNKLFRRHSTMKSHMRKHTSDPSRYCEICWHNFVDDRALKWHLRLHTGERPFACETCGRAFISLNRRNQHAMTAHTAPTKQCPLCPSLFHMRSMVNSHIKKVHIQQHKRSQRPTKQLTTVGWPTERVPVAELSADVQHELFDYSHAVLEASDEE